MVSPALESVGTDTAQNSAAEAKGFVNNRPLEREGLRQSGRAVARFSSIDHFVVALVSLEPGARCQICVCPNNGMPM
jgi:hypothetical protein